MDLVFSCGLVLFTLYVVCINYPRYVLRLCCFKLAGKRI